MSEYTSLDDIVSRKLTLFERVWYPIERNIKDIPYNLRKIKWFFQRGKRGWADCDTWGLDHYLARIMPEMLRYLQENLHSYPGYDEASTCGKWYDILEELIEGWEAANRVCDDEYYKQVSGDSIEAIGNATRKEIREWHRLSVKDRKLFEKKMKLFTKWFFHLWD